MEAEKQLGDKSFYKEVKCNKKLIKDLTETSKMFRRLKCRGFMTDKELMYFTFDHRRAWNLGKLYFLSKIHKRVFNVPG